MVEDPKKILDQVNRRKKDKKQHIRSPLLHKGGFFVTDLRIFERFEQEMLTECKINKMKTLYIS